MRIAAPFVVFAWLLTTSGVFAAPVEVKKKHIVLLLPSSHPFQGDQYHGIVARAALKKAPPAKTKQTPPATTKQTPPATTKQLPVTTKQTSKVAPTTTSKVAPVSSKPVSSVPPSKPSSVKPASSSASRASSPVSLPQSSALTSKSSQIASSISRSSISSSSAVSARVSSASSSLRASSASASSASRILSSPSGLSSGVSAHSQSASASASASGASVTASSGGSSASAVSAQVSSASSSLPASSVQNASSASGPSGSSIASSTSGLSSAVSASSQSASVSAIASGASVVTSALSVTASSVASSASAASAQISSDSNVLSSSAKMSASSTILSSSSASGISSSSVASSTSALPSGCAATPTSTIAPAPLQIPDRYIVGFDKQADLGSHLKQLQGFIDTNKNCSTLNNSVIMQFDEPFLKFYSGTFDGSVLQYISKSQGVTSLDRSQASDVDPTPTDTDTSQNSTVAQRSLSRRRTGATWGLARITEDGPVKPGTGGVNSETSTDWNYFLEDDANGKNVVVYVVDTGVMSSHSELTPRVLSVPAQYIPNNVGGNTEDVDGHGTAVAGVVAGLTLGVANAAQIVPIKIMTQQDDLITDTASTTLQIPSEYVAQGIGLALNHYETERKKQGSAVINLSITAWKGQLLQDAIDSATAGNNGRPVGGKLVPGAKGADVCDLWVADVGQINVGATDIADKMASFSNFGKCVDVYGPGQSIVTASKDGKVAPIDGTSFAAPHVAGMIAAILSKEGSMTPTAMKAKIISDAKGSVVDIADYANSNNRLVTFDPSLRDLMA
ncbi:peptidase S8/S53 domain-containing protein [Mycena epipterygia]|nr:peptidase S8/S53 domain-containing protein [Mycena epipterygia]